MANDKDGDAPPLGQLHEGHGTLLNLGDAPRRGGLVPMVHGLDGVYNHNLGLRLLNGSDDLLQAALSKEVEVHLPHAQPVCAELQLPFRLLP